MRLSRIFQGGWGRGPGRRPENSLENVFFFSFDCLFVLVQLILQFTEGIQWFYYIEN